MTKALEGQFSTLQSCKIVVNIYYKPKQAMCVRGNKNENKDQYDQQKLSQSSE